MKLIQPAYQNVSRSLTGLARDRHEARIGAIAVFDLRLQTIGQQLQSSDVACLLFRCYRRGCHLIFIVVSSLSSHKAIAAQSLDPAPDSRNTADRRYEGSHPELAMMVQRGYLRDIGHEYRFQKRGGLLLRNFLGMRLYG
jgi:hypothetical protein